MSKAEFLADVRAARAELVKILARSNERTLASARVPGMDWTAKDVLSHLIGYDHAILGAIKDVREGRAFAWGWTYPDFDPWNESNVGPRRSRPFLRGPPGARSEPDRAPARARRLARSERSICRGLLGSEVERDQLARPARAQAHRDDREARGDARGRRRLEREPPRVVEDA